MKKMKELLDARGEDGEILSTEVERDRVQNFEENLVCVAFDVEQLYPSMEVEEVARLMEKAVLKSGIKWSDLDYLEGARLLVLNRDEEFIFFLN